MHIEIQVALNFVISYLYNKLPRRRVNIFGEELEKALKHKFQGHWYPDKPFKVSIDFSQPCSSWYCSYQLSSRFLPLPPTPCCLRYWYKKQHTFCFISFFLLGLVWVRYTLSLFFAEYIFLLLLLLLLPRRRDDMKRDEKCRMFCRWLVIEFHISTRFMYRGKLSESIICRPWVSCLKR